MKSLFTFGCSYTEGFRMKHDNYDKYYQFLGGRIPESWPNILSKKLECNLKNCGEGASGNHQIFLEICKNCNEFKKEDIVVVQWSFIERYRTADDYGGWLKKGPGSQSFFDKEIMSDECHESILINRSKKQYIDEIYDYEKILDRLSKEVGFEIYYWTIINELIYNQPKDILNNKKYLLCDLIKDQYDNVFTIVLKNGGKWIFEETNNQIKDGHMGELGHKIQADLFYKHIMKYR